MFHFAGLLHNLVILSLCGWKVIALGGTPPHQNELHTYSTKSQYFKIISVYVNQTGRKARTDIL